MLMHLFCPSCQHRGSYFHTVDLHPNRVDFVTCSWAHTVFFVFFNKFLLDTCPFVGPLIPLFWTSGDVSSGFQSQSGFCLIHTWQRHTSNVTRSLRFTSGVTHLPVYDASIAASRLPHMRVSVEVGCRDLNRRPPARQSGLIQF